MEVIYLLLIPMFAILNRLRGADGYSQYAKVFIGIILGYLLWYKTGLKIYYSIPLMYILYRIGESFGWGKWIASIIDYRPQPNEQEGRSKTLGIYWWDGIHHLANWFVDEKKRIT
ncbi:MAG: hypothetical protein ABIH39_06230 [Candidatus Margulisiibacteriota bacterium]